MMESTPKNIRLECLFDRQARQRGAASIWRLDDGMVLRMCKSCVLMGPMHGSEKLNKGTLLPYRDMPTLNVSQPEAVLPGTLLDDSRLWLTQDEMRDGMAFIRVPAGVWPEQRMLTVSDAEDEDGMRIVAGHALDATSALTSLPVKFFSLPLDLSKDIGDAQDMKPCLTVTRLTPMPVLMLYGETSVLYLTLTVCAPSNPAHTVVVDNDGAYVFDGWSDKDGVWKKLMKEKKVKSMKTSTIPRPALSTSAPAAVTKATKENTTPEESAAVNAQVGETTTVPLASIPLATMPLAAMPDVVVATSPEQQAEMAPVAEEEDALSEEEAQTAVQRMKTALTGKDAPPVAAEAPRQDDKPKAKRVAKPVRAVGTDLSKVIETISADVDDINAEQFDAALNEIRALRDLQIAAARRMTNLCTAMCKFSQGAIDKYNKVLNALR